MADLKQILSMLPGLGAAATTQGGGGLGAFMDGYQRTMAMLEQQDRQRQGLELDREQLGMQRERYAAQDADRAREGQRADVGSLMDLLPILSGEVADAPAVTEAPPSGGGFPMVPPLGALVPTPEGVDPVGAVREQVGRVASGMGMAPEAAEAVAPMIRPILTRAQAAKANAWRAAVDEALKLAEKRSGATSEDLSAAGTVLEVRDPKTDQVVRVPYAEALEITGMPPLRAGQQAGGDEGKLTGEAGNRYQALRAAWVAEHPNEPVPPRLDAQWKKEATDEAYRKSGGGLNTMQGFTVSEKLASAWTTATASLREMTRQLGLMESGLSRFDADPNGASQAVLVTFQKILDPASVVRESEYARSTSGVSMLGRMEGYADRLARGGAGVPKDELAAMVETARQFVDRMKSTTQQQKTRIDAQVKKYGIDPVVIYGLESPENAPAPGTRKTVNGKTIEFDGAGWFVVKGA